MNSSAADTFWSHFDCIDDPRIDNHNKRHELKDIIVLTILGTLCGADTWVDIELFGQSKQPWLSRFLSLPNGIPSHDTLGRVIGLLKPKQLQSSFLKWAQSLVQVTDGEIIAIDGKTLRRSHDHGKGKQAIPALLDQLLLKGSTVTIDAMGCQKEIAKQIVSAEGDYVLALKGNQGTLREDVQLYLEDQASRSENTLSYYETVNKDHGRIEIRRHWLTDQIDWLDQRQDWLGLNSIGMVESERHVGETVTQDRRFYLCSLPNDVERFADTVRRHWEVENRLHWCLDVCFNEDQSRVRVNNAAENLAVIRHIALNLLRQETSIKVGLKAKRHRAGWDDRYLAQILAASGF